MLLQDHGHYNPTLGIKMYTIFDVETTTSNKGNPFDQTNNMVSLGLKTKEHNIICYGEMFYDTNVGHIILQEHFDKAGLIVGFNIKFDLHWARKVGIDVSNFDVWDCQLAEFILTGQVHRFPSLDQCLEKYGHPLKLDVVKNEYWDKGIDTDAIPREVLTPYLEGDLEGTEKVYLSQKHLFETTHAHLYPLFKLHCKDLLVLQEMEWNGIIYNEDKALAKVKEIDETQAKIKYKMDQVVGAIPYSLTSDADISSIIYGGVILKESRIPIGVFATGKKVGQTRYKVVYNAYECEGMVTPIKGSEVKVKISQKELDFVEKGILTQPRKQWSVDDKTLKKVKAKKAAREFIDLYQAYNKLEKLRSTGLMGCINIIKELNSMPNTLHPQLNQCVAITGRLSSSKPNGQNMDETTKRFCESRY